MQEKKCEFETAQAVFEHSIKVAKNGRNNYNLVLRKKYLAFYKINFKH